MQFRALRGEFTEGDVDFRPWVLGEITVLFVHFLLDRLVCIVSGLLDFLRANRIAAQNIAYTFTGADFYHGVLEQADMEHRIFE